MDLIDGSFIERIDRTATIASFRFNIGEKIDFIPGQHLEVIFDKERKELRHFLSFSSSLGRDYIEITKRLSDSPFSNCLRDLKRGDRVSFKGPLGNCVLDQSYKDITFLIGGIGITPVVSIVEYIVDRDLDIRVNLLYSNRSIEEIAFKDRFDSFKKRDNINVIYTVTDGSAKESGYYNGRIDKSLVEREVSNIKESLSYIFGPPKMVAAMKDLLLELGLSDNKIKTESFWGY